LSKVNLQKSPQIFILFSESTERASEYQFELVINISHKTKWITGFSENPMIHLSMYPLLLSQHTLLLP